MGDVRSIVGNAVRKHGAAKVARKLGISREAVLAYAGDFRTQAGTDAIIEQRAGRISDMSGPEAA